MGDSVHLSAALVELYAARKESAKLGKLLSKINAQHEKASTKTQETFLTEKQCQKLGGLYQQAAQLAGLEAQLALKASAAVSGILGAGGKKRKAEGGGGGRGRRKKVADIQHPVPNQTHVAAGHIVGGAGQWVLGIVTQYDFANQTVSRAVVVWLLLWQLVCAND